MQCFALSVAAKSSNQMINPWWFRGCGGVVWMVVSPEYQSLQLHGSALLKFRGSGQRLGDAGLIRRICIGYPSHVLKISLGSTRELCHEQTITNPSLKFNCHIGISALVRGVGSWNTKHLFHYIISSIHKSGSPGTSRLVSSCCDEGIAHALFVPFGAGLLGRRGISMRLRQSKACNKSS